ncbi:MAG: stage II sporulation protein D [Bacilli bacterium]|nr:stage II sporulation protein D [Bacilli bacterium]
MIDGYEIKIVNGEERLYLYLNIEFEFSKINNNSNNFKEVIINFLKNNKIKFHGTVVSIIIGGVLVGNLILNKPDNKENDSYYKPDIIEVDKLLYVPDIEINVDEEQKEDLLDVNTIDNNKEIASSNINTNTSSNSNYSKKKVTENNKTNNTINSSTNTSTNSNSNDNSNTNNKTQEEVVDNNTYVEVKRKSGKVEKIELETYIIGVVSAEMPALFHEEALKSQAIIARTYALKAIANNKQLTDTESTQSYKSDSELKSMWGSNFNTYYNKIKRCVDATSGMYLTYNGNYIEAVYHSTSNGKTESSVNVWNNYYPYLVSVDSIYDNINPSFSYEVSFTYQELSNKLGISISSDTNFNILGLTEGNRVLNIEINGTVFKGIDFRQKLGLRSADFTIEKNENGVVITTKGYGHGVGLSQYGANGYAKNGYSYIDILKHYYKGVTISYK